MKYVLIALGGGIGSVARYLLDGIVLRFGSPYFPSGTFVVNLVGCLVFGAIIGLTDERSTLTPASRLFLLIGLLGGFTTFSTFTFETFQLVRGGEYARGTVNAVGQVILGYAAMWAGFAAARAAV